jgi:hypothetical protein
VLYPLEVDGLEDEPSVLVELVLRALLFLVSGLCGPVDEAVAGKRRFDEEEVPLVVGWMGMELSGPESYPPHSSNGRFPCEWILTRCGWGGGR